MTHFTVKWKPDKAAKKLATAQAALLPGEDVWYLGYCNNFRPFMSEVALTSLRVVGLQDSEIKFDALYSEVERLTAEPTKETLELVRQTGEAIVFKMVPQPDLEAIEHYFQFGRSTLPPAGLLEAAQAAATNKTQVTPVGGRHAAPKERDWSDATVKGRPSRKANAAIARQCRGDEEPWFILTSAGGAGTLAAFEDRLVIIKTGALTSFMAGSLGGERSATFHFVDITGIEFNSGFVNGVLEILTPSYNGSANKDFWRGSTSSRNADSNDPWTLSNCLPLSKSEYNASLPEINELKSLIGRSKRSPTQVVAPSTPQPPGDLAEQLQKLAGLHQSGVLSDTEFVAAKARLLGS